MNGLPLPTSLERELQARLHCPGKIFILGEYSVLAGRPAYLTTVGPRFWLEAREGSVPGSLLGIASESPAGRLLNAVAERALGSTDSVFEFDDPFRGAGGFGASTAQFATLYRFFAERTELDLAPTLEGAFRFYRKLFSENPLPPSGADLAAQWTGGVTKFRISGQNTCEVESVQAGSAVLDHLWLFSATQQAGRKAATHTHLAELGARISGLDQIAELSRLQLDPQVTRFEHALEQGDLASAGNCLSAYADALSVAGLEIQATQDDRRWFLSQSGVLGAKGTGALQADALVVAIDPKALDADRLLQNAEARGLIFLGTAASTEGGLTQDFPKGVEK